MPLIGNKYTLGFETVPVAPSWETRYAPESVAWAGLAIWVNGENVCSHVVPGSSQVRDHLFVPLAPLADWLVRRFPALEFEERAAHYPTGDSPHRSLERWGDAVPPTGIDEEDWEDERERWWCHHFLAAGADGGRVPNLAFVRADEQLVIEWERPRLAARPPLVMLYPTGHSSVAWVEGRAILEAFVNEVAGWIRDSEAAAVFPWEAETRPLRPTSLETALELLTGRRIEDLSAFFGVDSPVQLIGSLGLEGHSDPAAAPQCQILRDVAPASSPDLASAVTEVGRLGTEENPEARAKWERMRHLALDSARGAQSREEVGQAGAIAVRRALGLGSQPIDDLGHVLHSGGVDWRHLTGLRSHHDRMLVGLGENGAPAAGTFDVPRLTEPWSRNFEAARALGHVLLDPIRAGAIGAASGSFSQPARRRRSGAFAAELLLPATAIAHESGGRLDGVAEGQRFPELMEKYGLGARAAAFQVWNRGWLSSDVVRDDLIEQHAASH
jgi:hypothetical protein